MRKSIWILISCVATAFQFSLWADPVVVWVVDPEDQETISVLNDMGISAEDSSSSDPKERAPLTPKHERLAKLAYDKQQELIRLLEEFLITPFDANDDNREPVFVEIRKKIVNLIFYSPSEKDFYQRLFIVNQSWLDHMDEKPRYDSLNREFQARWTELEGTRRRIQRAVSTGTAILGAAAGGWLSYKVSERFLPITAETKSWSLMFKWLGRTPMIIAGVYLGWQAGTYLGYLGSELILSHHYEFLTPIDGDEDLQDLLDQLEYIQ